MPFELGIRKQIFDLLNFSRRWRRTKILASSGEGLAGIRTERGYMDEDRRPN
jgi:hypothetical protein